MSYLNQAELIAFASEQGHLAAQGDDTLFAVASQCMYYGQTGNTDTDTFKPVYLAYAQSRNTSGYGRKIDTANEKSIAASASKLARFAKIGRAGYVDLPDRVAKLAPDGSLYEQMSRVFVAQLKTSKRLTDAEIKAALAPATAAVKSIGEFLTSEWKRMEKFGTESLEGDATVQFATLRAIFVKTATAWLENPDAVFEVRATAPAANPEGWDKIEAGEEGEPTAELIEDIAERLSHIGRVKLDDALVH